MKKFEIQYISRYCEEKHYYTEIISAKTETDALKKIAKFMDCDDYEKFFDPTFQWEDGSFISRFKCINEVKETVCLHCNGTGKIYLTE
ncbi:MAG: hypothetical protein KF721_14760 [Ignavibacteriaceae bacterium]|nr:hypothetical protein [Ignavibacteriaceae bacterium]